MKKIFISILTVAAVAACNKAEVIDQNPGEAIAFGEAFVDNATRAAADPSYGGKDADGNTVSLTSFNVYGAITGADGSTQVAIFDGDKVTGTVGQGNTWNCETTQYWIAGAKYNFAAVVNGKTVTVGNDKLPETIAYEADGETDLLYAKSAEYTGKDTGNDLVLFTFAHLLSKAKFTVTNTTPDTDYTYSVTGIKITNTYTGGTYTVATAAWAPDTDTDGTNPATEELSFGDIKDVKYSATTGTDNTTTLNGEECASEKLLVPGKYTAKIEFTVSLNYKGTLISTTAYTEDAAKTADVELKAGYAYNFNIKMGLDQPIQFTVKENPKWTADTSTDLTLKP